MKRLKLEMGQKLTMLYLVLGICAGLVSNTFTDAAMALLSSFALYIVSLVPLIKLVKHKKTKWLMYNSLVTFFLVWLTVWIFLINVKAG